MSVIAREYTCNLWYSSKEDRMVNSCWIRHCIWKWNKKTVLSFTGSHCFKYLDPSVIYWTKIIPKITNSFWSRTWFKSSDKSINVKSYVKVHQLQMLVTWLVYKTGIINTDLFTGSMCRSMLWSMYGLCKRKASEKNVSALILYRSLCLRLDM